MIQGIKKITKKWIYNNITHPVPLLIILCMQPVYLPSDHEPLYTHCAPLTVHRRHSALRPIPVRLIYLLAISIPTIKKWKKRRKHAHPLLQLVTLVSTN